MCDAGLMLGIAAGAASAASDVATANANIEQNNRRARFNQSSNSREFIVEADAANKDAYQASLEGDRAAAMVDAAGTGTQGATAGLRAADQSRQTALSIANAKDRRAAAGANYALSDTKIVQGASDYAASTRVSPLTALTNIATAGVSNYGSFRRT